MAIGIASLLPITSRNATKEAKHVAAFLYKMILQHGCPQEIVSDQGREFCNKLVDSLEELTGFKHKITSVCNPQSNWLDEHFNQTLKAQLQKLVKMTGLISSTTSYLPTGQVVTIQRNAPLFF